MAPTHQLSSTRKGGSSTKFIRRQDLPAMRPQLKTYQSMILLVDRRVELATELSTLRLPLGSNLNRTENLALSR